MDASPLDHVFVGAGGIVGQDRTGDRTRRNRYTQRGEELGHCVDISI
jgi:hypothetical protein